MTPLLGWHGAAAALSRVCGYGTAVLALAAGNAAAQGAADALTPRLSPDVLAVVAPNGERVGAYEGEPPAAPVYAGDDVVGFVFSTLDVVAAPGYSSVPFDIISGVAIDGALTGAAAISHSEPHIKNSPSRQALLDEFLASLHGSGGGAADTEALPPDFVSGATVSARLMRTATLESARRVMRGRTEFFEVSRPRLDVDGFRLATWEELLEDGTFATLEITNAELTDAFEAIGATPGVAIGPPGEPFIELYAALGTPPTVGRNVFTERTFADFEERAGLGGHVIIVAAKGDFDLRGSAYENFAAGYLFDRLALRQGERTIDFHGARYEWISTGSNYGIRALDTAMVFFLPADSGFAPLEPWRLLLTVPAAGQSRGVEFELPYTVPARYVLTPEEPEPAWVEAWRSAAPDIAILSIALGVLALIFVFQAPLTRRRRLHRGVRIGFLLFTLVWLGGVAGAQLSIVNVFNYAQAPFSGFGWEAYLAEPLIVIIAAFTALSLIVLGRGIFCGWLCPFGALQELLGMAARFLKLPRWNPKEHLQKLLWWVKYAIAVSIVGLAFVSLDLATTASEVEPFKTAITARFDRAWPFGLYAAALLLAGLFTERFYCRFLCPLGGALAILGRVHLFNTLKRRDQCGSPCHLCERSCAFKVIDSAGRIDMNECFQCQDCQVEYHDQTRCPPLRWHYKHLPTTSAEPDLPLAARILVKTATGARDLVGTARARLEARLDLPRLLRRLRRLLRSRPH